MKLKTQFIYILILLLSHITTLQSFPGGVELKVEYGFYEDGIATKRWREVIHKLRGDQFEPGKLSGKKRISREELHWKDLIEDQITFWQTMTDSIAIPFQGINQPETVTILIGNQYGEDAFIFADSIICFDLQRLLKLYKSATKKENTSRINRFFAHEYTHILHKIWRKKNPISLETPFEHALWGCLTEGLGNYRSLSGKWFDNNRMLSEHARTVLCRLQPIFVQRLKALKHATAEEAKSLMKGLSMGPFEQKWGALTVALWLAQEVNGDETHLQKWVNSGPQGVLLLAEKYLPDDLKEQMPEYR